MRLKGQLACDISFRLEPLFTTDQSPTVTSKSKQSSFLDKQENFPDQKKKRRSYRSMSKLLGQLLSATTTPTGLKTNRTDSAAKNEKKVPLNNSILRNVDTSVSLQRTDWHSHLHNDPMMRHIYRSYGKWAEVLHA